MPKVQKREPLTIPRLSLDEQSILLRKNLEKYWDIWVELQQQRTSLLEEAGRPLTLTGEPEPLADPNDQASTEQEHELELRLRQRALTKLRHVEEALHRMRTTYFGLCTHCGHDIPYDRLKVQPDTLLCVYCMILQENRYR